MLEVKQSDTPAKRLENVECVVEKRFIAASPQRES